MPILVLKETSSEIAPILQHIFLKSLNTGEISTDWKNANMEPIFKKGDRTKPTNYRPVSVTTVVSKMLEHIIVAQFMDHLDRNNILHENQHGFRARVNLNFYLLQLTSISTREFGSTWEF